MKNLLSKLEHNKDVTTDVALGVGAFATLLASTGDLTLGAVTGAAVVAGRQVLNLALSQVIAWANSHK